MSLSIPSSTLHARKEGMLTYDLVEVSEHDFSNQKPKLLEKIELTKENIHEVISKYFKPCENSQIIKKNIPIPFITKLESNNFLKKEYVYKYEAPGENEYYYPVTFGENKLLVNFLPNKKMLGIKAFSGTKYTTTSKALIKDINKIRQLQLCSRYGGCPYLQQTPEASQTTYGLGMLNERMHFIVNCSNPLYKVINDLSFERKLSIIGQIVEGINFATEHKRLLLTTNIYRMRYTINNDHYQIEHSDLNIINFEVDNGFNEIQNRFGRSKYGEHFSTEDHEYEIQTLNTFTKNDFNFIELTEEQKSKLSKNVLKIDDLTSDQRNQLKQNLKAKLIRFYFATGIYALGRVIAQVMLGSLELKFETFVTKLMISGKIDVYQANENIKFSKVDRSELKKILNKLKKSESWKAEQIDIVKKMLQDNWEFRPQIDEIKKVFGIKEGPLKNILIKLEPFEKTHIIAELTQKYLADESSIVPNLQSSELRYHLKLDNTYSIKPPDSNSTIWHKTDTPTSLTNSKKAENKKLIRSNSQSHKFKKSTTLSKQLSHADIFSYEKQSEVKKEDRHELLVRRIRDCGLICIQVALGSPITDLLIESKVNIMKIETFIKEISQEKMIPNDQIDLIKSMLNYDLKNKKMDELINLKLEILNKFQELAASKT